MPERPIVYVDRGDIPPHVCIRCTSKMRLWDIGAEERYAAGMIYLCTDCLRLLAGEIGFIDPDVHEAKIRVLEANTSTAPVVAHIPNDPSLEVAGVIERMAARLRERAAAGDDGDGGVAAVDRAPDVAGEPESAGGSGGAEHEDLAGSDRPDLAFGVSGDSGTGAGDHAGDGAAAETGARGARDSAELDPFDLILDARPADADS